MWKLVAFIAAIVFACLLTPFTVLGVLFFGPSLVAAIADRVCRG